MSAPRTDPCFGRLFPDLEHMPVNKPHRGAVFGAQVTSQGIGVQGREVLVDMDAFWKCRECKQYEACRDLSFGRMLMHLGLHA